MSRTSACLQDERGAYSPAKDKPVSPSYDVSITSSEDISAVCQRNSKGVGGGNGTGGGEGERKIMEIGALNCTLIANHSAVFACGLFLEQCDTPASSSAACFYNSFLINIF